MRSGSNDGTHGRRGDEPTTGGNKNAETTVMTSVEEKPDIKPNGRVLLKLAIVWYGQVHAGRDGPGQRHTRQR